MRLLLAILIAVFLLGGTFFYTRFAGSVQQQTASYRPRLSQRTYAVEILRTFNATANPAAAPNPSLLQLSTEYDSAALVVLFKGNPVLLRKDEVAAEETLKIDSLADVEVGANELFFKARLKPPVEGELAAMQVRVSCEGKTVSEACFTGYSGSPIIFGTLLFDVISDTVDESKSNDQHQ